MKKFILILAVLMIISMPSFAEEEVEVQLPEFDVVINGLVIDNHKEDFPFIEYNGITYLPMTYDLSSALGLSAVWNAESGLKIRPSKKAYAYESKGTSKNMFNRKYKASIVGFPVEVNGENIDNAKEDYPLLSFRDVTYFPMTYKFMVDAFQSGYNFTSEKGLEVSANESMPMVYPEKIVKEFEVDIDQIKDDVYFVNEFIKLEYDDQALRTNITNFDENSQYAGMHLNIYVDYYDLQDKYIMTRVLNAGIPQGYETRVEHTGLMFLYNNTNHLKFRFEFENVYGINETLKEAKENYKFEVTTSDKASLEYLKSLGGAFMSVKSKSFNGVDKNLSDDEYIYSAFLTENEYNVNDMEISITTYGSTDGTFELDIKPRNEDHIDFKSCDNIVYNPFDLNDHVFVKNGDTVLSIESGSNLYLYDTNKKLVAIVVLKDIRD